MHEILIFDTCSIINFLHLDGTDDDLYKWIMKFSPFFSECVMDEVWENLKKVPVSQEEQHTYETKISSFYATQSSTKEIESYDDGQMIKELKSFSKHTKKLNGEFYSTALCLLKNKQEGKQTLLITDDFPAKDEFRAYFQFHQIGRIGDSVDLLLYLFYHTNETDFNLIQLKQYLTELMRRYFEPLKVIEEKTKKYIELLSKKKDKSGNKLHVVLDMFYNNPSSFLTKLQKFLSNKNDDYSKDILTLVNSQIEAPQIITKIQSVLAYLNKYKTYRIKGQ